MKRNITSFNEEMNRIKSLFTEERMFGNLVEQEETEKEEKKGEEKVSEKDPGKKCVETIKNTYKEVSSSGDAETWKKSNTIKVTEVESCLKNYSEKFEKEGLFRAGDEASKLKEILKLEVEPTETSSKQTFDVKDKYGKVIMKIVNKENNVYNFRSTLGSDLFDSVRSGGLGKRKYFDPQVEEKVRQTLNLDKSKNITIQKGMNVKGFDSGTFMVS
jgi:hypothetical protein